MKDKRKILAPAVITFLALLLLMKNPSNNDFEKYLAKKKIPDTTERRDANLFLCSIYSCNKISYLGLLGNFIKL